MLAGQFPALPLWIARSKDEADAMLHQLFALHADVKRYRDKLKRGAPSRGYSVTAQRVVDFEIAWPGEGEPNWRETVRCPASGVISRLRGCYHAWRTLRPARAAERIYLTEGATDFSRFMQANYPGTIGSEYLVDTPFGQTDAAGVRSEDMTALTFADASFDVVMSFEVLEHVPDYRAALAECARVLAPGGVALLTAPFVNAAETLVRATVAADGAITHHETPDYHGDPLNAGGILCYYWFGWSLIDDLRAAGFADAYVAYFASRQFGYLEPMQSVIVATK